MSSSRAKKTPLHLLAQLLAVFLFANHCNLAIAEFGERKEERANMVRTIENHAASLPTSMGSNQISEAVLGIMGEVPRHHFVPQEYQGAAYGDHPLPIGYGQTISQPFIVALMTDLLKADPEAVVLEIGTGSGYQAAVLAKLLRKACTIEIIPELGKNAARQLRELGFNNVQVKVGDGYYGWPECGPFDGIIVTAAAGHVPPPLIEQLKPGGRMVIPVGGVFGPQYLTLVEKTADGELKTRQLLPVRFVPFTRGSR